MKHKNKTRFEKVKFKRKFFLSSRLFPIHNRPPTSPLFTSSFQFTTGKSGEAALPSNLGFLPDGKMGVRSTLCLASNQGATWITWPHYLRRS